MKDFFKELENLKKKISLNKSIEESFRSRLIDHVFAGSDVRDAEALRHNTQRSNFLYFLQYKFMPIFLIVALLVSAGGGVSLAAEHALPGDALYPIKVGFNEKVVAAFSASADAKANWEVRLAERRLEEAADLTTQGKMSAEVEENIRSRFAAHAERVGERISEIEARGRVRNASEVASRFEVSLKAHEDILKRLQSTSSAEVSLRIGKIKTKVESELDDTEEARERLEVKIKMEDGGSEIKSAANGKIGAARNVIDSVRADFERNKVEFSAAAVLEIEGEIKMAENALVDAGAKFRAGTYGEAFVLAQKALRAAQEARGEIKEEIQFGKKDEAKKKDGSEDAEDDNSTSNVSGSIEVEIRSGGNSSGSEDGRGVRGNGSVKVEIGL
ncbi:MAG: DUF5667 domain-containing protein [bacterium]|nr:DUF5667 domain-containing protein [bacterium]